MALAALGKLNLEEAPPIWGSRSVDCFEKIKLISHGTYGEVYMAKEIETGEIVALKKIRTNDEREGGDQDPEEATSSKRHQFERGSNLLIDKKGNLKLADFTLARTLSLEFTGTLTNQVTTLWYRAPELLLGATEYGPAVDMWSVACLFAELLNGEPIFPGKTEIDQLKKIYDLCGSPDENNWPGVSEMPLYKRFEPSLPLKRRLIETYGHFDAHALELLECMLVLDPPKRISAKDALDSDYFWSEPLPCEPKRLLASYKSSHELQTKKKRKSMPRKTASFDRHALELLEKMLVLGPSQRICAKDAEYFWTDPLPYNVSCPFNSLPTYESSHEFQTKKMRQQMRHNEEAAKKQKLQQQGGGQSHAAPHWPSGPNHSMNNVVTYCHHNYPLVDLAATTTNQKQRGGGAPGPNRYPPSANQSGGYNYQSREGYSSGPYPPQGRGAPYGAGPSGGYGVGPPPNYSQGGGQYGGSGRGQNPTGGARNQQYGWQP
ncbi:hypothetical protein Bca4012_005447 [Brassica carinata]